MLAQIRLVHEPLERIHLHEALEQLLLLICAEWPAEGARLDVLAQPHALAVGGDVLYLVRDRPAIGLAQVRQRLGERVAGNVHAQDLGRDLRHQLGRESERLWVQRGVALGLGAERVQAGGEMAVGAKCLQQRRGGLHRLQQLLHARRRGRLRCGSGGDGGHGGRRQLPKLHAQRGEHGLVEAVCAVQVVLDKPEEAPGLGALDDAVIVRRGHRHDLLRPDRGAGLGEAGGITDRAGGHDRALAAHQSGHRRHRSQPAGVGQGDVGAEQIIGGERVRARLLDQRVIGLDEAREG